MPAIISEWGSTDLWYEHLERAVSNSSGHFSFSPSHILSLILQFLPSFTDAMLMSYEPSYWIYWFLPWFFWDSNVVRRNNAKVSGWASKARPQVELGSDYAWSVSTLQALQHSLQSAASPQVKLRSYLAQLKHSKRAHSLVWVLIKRSRRAASHNRETLSIAAISFCPTARSNKAQVTASMWERDLEVIAI